VGGGRKGKQEPEKSLKKNERAVSPTFRPSREEGGRRKKRRIRPDDLQGGLKTVQQRKGSREKRERRREGGRSKELVRNLKGRSSASCLQGRKSSPRSTSPAGLLHKKVEEAGSGWKRGRGGLGKGRSAVLSREVSSPYPQSRKRNWDPGLVEGKIREDPLRQGTPKGGS